jgi:hypothetical protein
MAKEAAGLVIRLSTNATEFLSDIQKIENNFRKIEARASELKCIGAKFAVFGGAIVGGLGLAFKSFANNADELSKMSQKTGIAVESLQELKYAAQASGTSIDSVIAGTRNLSRTITEAADGNKTYCDSFKRIGIKINDIKNLSTEEQFNKIASAVANIHDPAEKTARAIEFFGRSGTDLLPMLKDGSAGLEAMRQEFQKYGAAIDANTAQAAEEFNNTLSRLGASFKAIITIVSARMLPILQWFASFVSDIVLSVKTFTEKHKTLASVLAGSIAGIGAVALAIGTITVALGYVVGIAPAVATVWSLITGPIGITIAAVAGLTAGLILLWKNWESVKHYLIIGWRTTVDAILKSVELIIEGLVSSFGKIPVIGAQLKNALISVQNQIAENGKSKAKEEMDYKMLVWQRERAQYCQKEKDKQNQLRQTTKAIKDNSEAQMKAMDAHIAYEKAQFSTYSLAQKRATLELERQVIAQRIAVAKVGTEAYYQILKQQYENQKAIIELGNYEFVSGFGNAFLEIQNKLIDFKEVFMGIYNEFTQSLSSQLVNFVNGSINTWDKFKSAVGKIWDTLKQSVIKALADMLAKQIAVFAVEKAVAAGKVMLNAGIAGSDAAAKDPNPFTKIATGLLVFAGVAALVSKMSGAFAKGGIVGGTSWSGDNVIARVNSGEMILNRAQQANLLGLANGDTLTSPSSESIINQTINIETSSENSLQEISEALRKGTQEALTFAGLTYRVGSKQAGVAI